jgi:hypothetical protein
LQDCRKESPAILQYGFGNLRRNVKTDLEIFRGVLVDLDWRLRVERNLLAGRLLYKASAELIGVANRLAVLPQHFDNLLAAHIPTELVNQTCHALLGLCVDDISGRRIGVLPIEPEAHPVR